MKKNLFALLLALFPLFAFADAVEIDGIYYNLISKGKVAEVTSHPNKYSGNVIIPSSVVYEGTGYFVKSIGEKAFEYCNDLTSVILPATIKSINSAAFQYCSKLESINIPEGVEEIPKRAFAYCYKLQSINIPSSLSKIGGYAFDYCGVTRFNIVSIESWLNITIEDSPFPPNERHLFIDNEEVTDVTIPATINTVKPQIFAKCSGLKSIQFHDKVTSIEDAAFYGCTGLTTISLPESILFIENMAFSACTNLESINIPSRITSIGYAFNGCTSLKKIIISDGLKKLEQTFGGCSSLTSIVIPNSVEIIGNYTFYNCSSLQTVKIGSRVTSVGLQAFANCDNLSEVYCYANSIPSSNEKAFSDSYVEYATVLP